ncbi:FadR/GntR family transcriptional regulator [Rhizobacter sp. OV335]|jgi:DNA-binding FadR family transcriptional regulator|uniref:FadR/GntR family transcriptional regulator n=1 Tax=Rhizobacter sp. OV335 TaxID=1500264 RepID=UPI000923F4A4|nr:FCD domain-containing protein [Rhizobacter sp. OV335]SHN01739.1 DNA-binding transcriptional regulator, FadR family [Rhizobacter sp. OV335]
MSHQRLPPIETKRLYQHIAGVLRESMDSGRFGVGSYLPPERELADQLGVSRASVREALIALEVQGRVSVRVGAGVQVLDASAPKAPASVAAAATSEDEPPVGPLELLEARLVVETETAALAARHATAQDLQGLQRSLDQMVQDHARNPMLHDGDRAFHIGIARASGNAALLFIVTTLWDQRYTPMQERMETLFTTPGLHVAAVDDHRRVLEAIAAHDPAAARQAMRRHLTTVRKTFSRAIVAGR